MVQPTRPLNIVMPPRTRSMAEINRDGINTYSHPHDEGTGRSHSPVLLQRSSSGSSTSFPDSPSSLIFDPPDRQSTVSSALTTPPPRHPPFDLTAWLAASRVRYRADWDAWRQGFDNQLRLVNWIYFIVALVLSTALVWVLATALVEDSGRGRFLHPTWTLDTTIPDIHITNDAALLCHSRDCGSNAGFIPLRDPAAAASTNPLSPPLLPSSAIAGSISRSRNRDGREEEEGVGNVGLAGLRYGNAALGAIGHVHLYICLDGRPTVANWWQPHLCNRTELFTLDPVVYVPSARTNRISFALLVREERHSGRDRSLPPGVYMDGGDGSVVVRGMVFQRR